MEPFRFDRRWTLPAPPEDLWATLSATPRYRTWWAWLAVFDAPPLEVGARAHCEIAPPLPYRLRLRVSVKAVEPRRLVETCVDGDLEGPARLELAPDPGGGSAVRLTWVLSPARPLLVAAARVARPLLVWGHNQVVEAGMREFVRVALPPSV